MHTFIHHYLINHVPDQSAGLATALDLNRHKRYEKLSNKSALQVSFCVLFKSCILPCHNIFAVQAVNCANNLFFMSSKTGSD